MAISHANCTHPRTPAGRRACRAGNAPAVTVPTVAPALPGVKMIPPLTGTVFSPEYAASEIAEKALAEDRARRMIRERRDGIKMTGPVARRMARQAAKADRIQPKRAGARVTIDSSGCVQAALHTSGRCACGWHAANHCNPAVWACAGH